MCEEAEVKKVNYTRELHRKVKLKSLYKIFMGLNLKEVPKINRVRFR